MATWHRELSSYNPYTVTAVREGIALSEEGLSPYAGDIFHEVMLLIPTNQYLIAVQFSSIKCYIFCDHVVSVSSKKCLWVELHKTTQPSSVWNLA